MINADKIIQLMINNDQSFYDMYYHEGGLTKEQSEYLSSLNLDQVDEFVNRCTNDMLSVDRITKEMWLRL